MKWFLKSVALAGMVAAPGHASSLTAPDGADISVTINRYGAVLEDGEARVIYLGRGCDIASPTRGEGRWYSLDNAIYLQFIDGSDLSLRGSLPRAIAQNCPL